MRETILHVQRQGKLFPVSSVSDTDQGIVKGINKEHTKHRNTKLIIKANDAPPDTQWIDLDSNRTELHRTSLPSTCNVFSRYKQERREEGSTDTYHEVVSTKSVDELNGNDANMISPTSGNSEPTKINQQY